MDLVGKPPPPADPSQASRSATPASRAVRLPAGWRLPKAWGEWALGERPDWGAEDVRKCAERFRDHWLAKGGADARKVDWEATWRNWIRREPNKNPTQYQPQKVKDHEPRPAVEAA